MLPGMVACERARSYKPKGEFQADNNHEFRAKNLIAHHASSHFVVELQQGQAASSAEISTENEVDIRSQDPSDTDGEDEDPVCSAQLDLRRSRRFSLTASVIELTRALSRPTSILITKKKRLERNNRPKAVTELRRVHFRIPKAKRSWRLKQLEPAGAAVKYWRMACSYL